MPGHLRFKCRELARVLAGGASSPAAGTSRSLPSSACADSTARPGGAHLAGQFASPSRRSAAARRTAASLLSSALAALSASCLAARGGFQCSAFFQDAVFQRSLFFAGPAPRSVRAAQGPGRSPGLPVGGTKQPAPLIGKGPEGAKPLPPRRELVPRVPGSVEFGRGLCRTAVPGLPPLASGFQALPNNCPRAFRDRISPRPGPGWTVTATRSPLQEPRPGVPYVKLDALGPARHFGLFAERGQLTADLAARSLRRCRFACIASSFRTVFSFLAGGA